MEYLVKTLRLRPQMEEMECNDKELTANLNLYANRGYYLDRIIPDERSSPTGDEKRVYLLIFKK